MAWLPPLECGGQSVYTSAYRSIEHCLESHPEDPAGAARSRALRVIQRSVPPPPARSEAAQTATQRIVDVDHPAIVERRLQPGTKLAEQKLADIFGVSRTLVRQALFQLSRRTA